MSRYDTVGKIEDKKIQRIGTANYLMYKRIIVIFC